MIEAKRIIKIVKVTALIVCISISSYALAQKQFIITTSKANNTCNGDCTMLDVPELNNNPAAIIWVTPIIENELNVNPHPIGVYYSQQKWRIFNLDQTSIPPGAKFSVEYITRPDQNHFQYEITNENIQKDGAAFIDHPALNNNPNVKFQLVPSWGSQSGQAPNRQEINKQYNADAGKWSISNINKKFLYQRVTYNIIVSSGADSIANTRSSASQKAVMINELNITPANKSTVNSNSTSGQVTQMYMTVWANGTIIPGDNIREAYRDKTQILSFEMGASAPTSSGMFTGKRAYEPITIKSKSGYPAALPLFGAFVKNQDIAVTIEAYTTSPDGREDLNYSIKLTNAHISAFKQVYEEVTLNTGGPTIKKDYDEIKIIFKKIEFIKGKMSVDDNL
ncbi:MAG: type VI secretion system tube protein Hcp [Ginsengibacter sp.]